MLFDREANPPAPNASRGVAGSALGHAALLLLAVALAHRPATDASRPVSPEPTPTLVWVPRSETSGGGGGGGGNRRPEPPRAAEASGRDRITVRTPPPADIAPTAPPREADPTVLLSAEPLAAGLTALAGVLEPAPAASAESIGAGTGAGTDGRDGPGSGSGRGPGVGPGAGGETGGVGPPGNGVSWPRLLRDVKPVYTAEAMRARVTGSVGLSCVVDRDGSVNECRLTRSLDPTYGLDQEAVRAVRQWRFAPALRLDEPVPVRVTIELAFSLR